MASCRKTPLTVQSSALAVEEVSTSAFADVVAAAAADEAATDEVATDEAATDETAADEESLALPAVPKGNVLGCEPFVTDLPRAGSKKTFGSFAGSCAWTSPFNCAFLGAVWQKTELRLVGGLVVKSCSDI